MKRCLVVDDSNVIRKITRHILEDLNYEVAEAENGQEALDRCRGKTPDIIFLDWHMPVMSALEFLAALRVANTGKRPYIVYCTTENDAGDISRAITAGADDFMMKPFDRAMLVGKLSDIEAAAA